MDKERKSTFEDLKESEKKKEDLIQENNELEAELNELTDNSEQLIAHKNGLNLELNRAKEELSALIERTETQKGQLSKEIAHLELTERKLTDIKRKEEKQFKQVEMDSQNKILALSETLQKKEHEIDNLKGMLNELSAKEDFRMEELELESRNIKEILENDDFEE